MSKVFFRPFVGKDYHRGGIFGRRVMVLGESHYCDEGCEMCGVCSRAHECNAFTQNVLRDYLDPSKKEAWMSTYLKFERSLVGVETDDRLRQKIWDSVLLYNFLQVAMDGTREAGSGLQYRQAAEPFFEVIDTYRPERVIVWGKRLWNALPDERWVDGADIIIDDTHIKTGAYRLHGGGVARVMAVYHPSVGYSWDWWHRAIAEFIK